VKHPPYHLRPNKAIDRFLLVEILSILGAKDGRYRYYGLGGPFLEEFRLIGQHFEGLPMTSLEANLQTFRRQTFHRCAKNLTLRNETLQSFLVTYPGDERAVFWLDYTDLQPAWIQEFQTLLDRVGDDSVVKITLRASLDDLPDDLLGRIPEFSADIGELCDRYLVDFKAKYDAVLPPTITYGQLRRGLFPELLQDVLQIAAQRALPAGCGRTFQILHSCFYSDHTQMYSLTGVVCRDAAARDYRSRFASWRLRNLRWAKPKRIDVPILSVKERIFLERHLPAKSATGKGLRRSLGYNIDDGVPASHRQLQQYATFFRYYPYFARVSVV
jgi:hypothetical protein